MTDVDTLPPTQQLILEVFAGRYRLGEQVWTFPTTLRKPLSELADRGLVTVLNGIAEKSVRARLTDAGKALMLDERYRPPNGGIERYRQALQAIVEYCEARADVLVELDGIARTARQALEGGPR